MSVVAAKVYDDRIEIAADSILTNGYMKRNSNFSKLSQINSIIIGGCGGAQELSLMWQYMITTKPSTATCEGVLNFFNSFAKWKKDMDGQFYVENTYLVLFDGHLFEVEHMFVHEIEDFIAIGAGEEFASAALYLGHTPEEAVRVSCKLSCYVCEPIVMFNCPNNKSAL